MRSIIWPVKFPVLKTERLLLRRVTEKDAGVLFKCYSDPEVMKYMATPLDDEESITGVLEDYIDGFTEGSNMIWAVTVRGTAAFAGTAGFEEFSFLDGKAEIGFSLLSSHQGAGFMHEALREILRFGFHDMLLNRIFAAVVPENTSSVKLLEKLGFQREGHMKQSIFFNGHYHDEMILALLNPESDCLTTPKG